MPEPPAAGGGGEALSPPTFEERLARLDELLARVEQLPGAMGELAVDAVAGLTEMYGAALQRVMARVQSIPEAVASLSDDELLSHLFALHGVHPLPVGERVARAIDEVRPAIRSHGGDIELVGIAEGVVRVRLSGTCNGCASSSGTLEQVVSEAVLAVAPEIERVEPVAPEPAPQVAFVPLADLRRAARR